jgi:hypothetical protein
MSQNVINSKSLFSLTFHFRVQNKHVISESNSQIELENITRWLTFQK